MSVENRGNSDDHEFSTTAMPFASTTTRRLSLALKSIILAITAWYIWHTVASSWDQLSEHKWQVDFGWIAASGMVYLLGLLPAGIFFQRVLRELGQRPPLSVTLRAYYIGHLGKYVPGKAMVVLLRSGLLARFGVPTKLAVVSVLIETLTMMAVGAFLAAAIDIFLYRGQTNILLGSCCLMIVAGIPTLPPVMNWLLRRQFMQSPKKENESTQESGIGINWRLIGNGWVLNIIVWFILGTSLAFILRELGTEGLLQLQAATLFQCTAAVALAVVAGFLSGIPGGIGVRDGILIALLATIVPEEIALVSTVLLRIVWLVSELVISGILVVWQRT